MTSMVSRAIPDDAAWYPQPTQQAFLEHSAFEVMYGGAAGGGKTDALLAWMLGPIAEPTYRGLVLRREWVQAERALIPRSWELYPLAGGRWRGKTKLWVFESGASIEFGHAEYEKDVHKYQGAPYQRIAFDEATHFTEYQVNYMRSRLRSAGGKVRSQIRYSANPGGVGHDHILARFAPWLYPRDGEPYYDPEYKGPWADPGERLWYKKVDGKDVVVARGTDGALSRSFIPSRVSDNVYYAGTEYEAILDSLDPLTRAQLKHGNWMARAAAGIFFKRPWFRFLGARPDDSQVLIRVRYWDRASSEDLKADATAGVLLAYLRDKRLVVEDVKHGRWTPEEVKLQIRECCESDPDGTRHVLEKDPGQAGVFEWRDYAKYLQGFDVHAVAPMVDKIVRAKPWSAQVEAGNVYLVRAPWNERYIAEHEGFPEGHDDLVDASDGAMREALQNAGIKAKVGGRRDRRANPLHSGGY